MTSAPVLLLPAEYEAAIRLHLEACYPEEGCALLIGHERPNPDGWGGTILEVTRVVPAANIHPEPRRAFELDPSVLFGVLRGFRDAELDPGMAPERLLGHAHSHPDSPALPSDKDRAMAWESGLAWLIAEIRDGRLAALTAWLAEGEGAAFGPVTLTLGGEKA